MSLPRSGVSKGEPGNKARLKKRKGARKGDEQEGNESVGLRRRGEQPVQGVRPASGKVRCNPDSRWRGKKEGSTQEKILIDLKEGKISTFGGVAGRER